MKWFKKASSSKGVGKAPAMLIILGLVFGPLLFTAPAAHAGSYDDLTGNPGQECRPQSLGNAAGSGFPGLVDPKPVPIVPSSSSPAAQEAADNAQNAANKRIYHVYGWSGYNWEVCATGGPIKGAEALGNTDAWSDNERGSTMLKTATAVAALNTGVAKMAATPGEVMKPLDNIVADVSKMLRVSLVDLWLPIVLVAAGALLAVNAINGNMRKALASIGAVLVALFAVAYLSFAPLEAAKLMDGISSAGQAAVLQNAAKFSGKEGVPADEVWGVIYTEDIIFPLWAQGITGWSYNDSRLNPNLDGERLGPNVEAKQKFDAFTPTRAYQIRAYPWGAAKDEKTDNNRRDAWNTIGEASQTKDAPTRAFTGQEQNRTGMGAMALASVTASASYNIPANLLIFVAQIAFRLLPIFGFALALLLAFEPTRPLAYVMGRFFLACLVNGVIVGIFAGVHLAIVGALFNSTLGPIWATIATAIVSVLFFKITKPIRSLTNTAVSLGKGIAKTGRQLRSNAKTDKSRTDHGPNAGNVGTSYNDREAARTGRQLQPLKPNATRTLISTGHKNGSLINQGVKTATNIVPGPVAKTATKLGAGHIAGRAAAQGAAAAVTHSKNKPGTTNAATKSTSTTPSQARYVSLQQAQREGQIARTQRRMFVPPTDGNPAPQGQPAHVEKGDRPARKKFVPPAPEAPKTGTERTVEPLKKARS